MYIIFGQDAYNKLKENYTLLEVESVIRDATIIPAYCVVPAGQISLEELGELEDKKAQHAELLSALRNGETQRCIEIATKLRGSFGRELDSFYDEILSRLSSS